MPARRTGAAVGPLEGPSMARRTGIRWTTLTQFPDAFCAGRTEKTAPVPWLMLATRAFQTRPG